MEWDMDITTLCPKYVCLVQYYVLYVLHYMHQSVERKLHRPIVSYASNAFACNKAVYGSLDIYSLCCTCEHVL